MPCPAICDAEALTPISSYRATENRIRRYERLKTWPERFLVCAFNPVYAVLGDKGSALRVLRYSIEKGFFSYAYFVNDPLLKILHDEAEFARLMDLARQRHSAFKAAFF
jgi:hypothetical protein